MNCQAQMPLLSLLFKYIANTLTHTHTHTQLETKGMSPKTDGEREKKRKGNSKHKCRTKLSRTEQKLNKNTKEEARNETKKRNKIRTRFLCNRYFFLFVCLLFSSIC